MASCPGPFPCHGAQGRWQLQQLPVRGSCKATGDGWSVEIRVGHREWGPGSAWPAPDVGAGDSQGWEPLSTARPLVCERENGKTGTTLPNQNLSVLMENS